MLFIYNKTIFAALFDEKLGNKAPKTNNLDLICQRFLCLLCLISLNKCKTAGY